MILVLGASGKVGGSTLQQLVDMGVPVRAFGRDSSKFAGMGLGVEAVQGDLDRPETLAPALEGVDKVFVIAAGNDVPAEDVNAIDAAEKAGVQQLVLLSSLGVEAGVASGPLHAPGEERLRSSSLSWTILRPGFFMANAFMWRDTIRSDGAFYEPTGDGRHALVHPGDVGAVAAEVLTGAGHDGKIYELTGPEALSSAECAAVLAAVLGIEVRHVDIPDEAFRDGMTKAGAPPFLVDALARYYAMVRAGEFAMVTPTVEVLVGRPARTFGQWAEEHASAFA